jgi:hypothetical protein
LEAAVVYHKYWHEDENSIMDVIPLYAKIERHKVELTHTPEAGFLANTPTLEHRLSA